MAINYVESDDTKKRREYLEGISTSKPTAYQSENSQATKNAMNTLLNRKAFQYDVNEDALYQQMKNDYIQQGKLAMQDTMGQAATLTGGYGNSYAQGVGQQAYNSYLQQLNDNLPEYYQMAQNAYDAEGDRLKEQYSLLADQEAQDYSRYQDAWNRWNSEYQNAQSAYETGRSWDYGVAQDNAALAQTQVNYLISQGITPNAELLAAAGYDQQYINQVVADNGGNGSGGSGGGGGGSTGGKKRSSDDDNPDDDNNGNGNPIDAVTWEDVVGTAITRRNNGEDVDAYIQAARRENVITPQQAKDLKINIDRLGR